MIQDVAPVWRLLKGSLFKTSVLTANSVVESVLASQIQTIITKRYFIHLFLLYCHNEADIT